MDLPILPCACANLRRASRALTQLYDDELRPTGLRVTQLGILMALATAGELGQGRLAAAMAFDSTTLTRGLAVLRKQGWIEVRPGTDRRERRLSLTPKGREKVGEMRPHWERAQERVRRALGRDYDQLQGLLHRAAQTVLSPS